ncbi:DEAD/DEAH box helicase [Streptomyces sp. DT2A-34]|uniref:DEAD/DEAH box helicase n=1 Tax=Streptomyces sp. DT2A-34 TaxID=3051182 RepID=UPI00265C4C45|nr:DEAD/DEAH box helicase [Streptomyces sp. DT2A-34]MDO0911149.1 DEAD/DEAH box helicase [Streptomyces sp. DT2A-34]
MAERWKATLSGLLERFEQPGWTYEEAVKLPCPACEGEMHVLRKPYESAGKTFRYVAVVCPGCPLVYTLADLGLKNVEQLRKATHAVPSKASVTVPPSSRAVKLVAKPERWDLAPVAPVDWGVPAQRARKERGWPPGLPEPSGPETRALRWFKVSDPSWTLDTVSEGVDMRVILPESEEFAGLQRRLAEASIACRSVPYWIEHEEVTTVGNDGQATDLVAYPRLCQVTGEAAAGSAPVGGRAAYAARDSFERIWDALAPVEEDPPAPQPVAELVPESWAALLPYPTFNPAQIAAVPVVCESDQHVVVVAPTGAGKTPIGMVAALRAYFEGRKAAWLVPQRSLTDELDRDLDFWRSHGLRVVRLSGEHATDRVMIQQADVWVTTTEKFEALCRAASMREALADVGCLVVDEIHLLGDPVRGPVLEALLARVRESVADVRIVGLSATVSNAEDIAQWLNAQLVRVSWRPTRLAWQLPMIATSSDRTTQQLTRTQAAVRIASAFTAEGGSVLVFCGSKRSVRTTALAISESRGATTRGVDPDDADRVQQVCQKVGVGLHYRDWPYKREAVTGFRQRELDVVVATSTLAAGVNLPARAVVVRDTQVGLDEIEVSMVQQMFGRAGRVGAGEREGWAFLITDEAERAIWQAKLAAGYTVASQIRSSLPDHVLAEVVQGRISTVGEAEAWWKQTLAYHQGDHRMEPLHEALDFLVGADFLTCLSVGQDGDLQATELGRLTTRLMVSTHLADQLRVAARGVALPSGPDEAEELLIDIVSLTLPDLAQAPVSEQIRAATARLLQSHGHTDPTVPGDTFVRGGLAASPGLAPGDFARAVLLTLANSPRQFRKGTRYITGIPVEAMYPILEEAERYLYWLGAQGALGTLHPWTVIVAGDLARRIRWRHCAPRRGAGRLLWMLEQMATAPQASTLVPRMWRAATGKQITDPDWPTTARPSHCQLPDTAYMALLRDRVTGSIVDIDGDHATWSVPAGLSRTTWTGTAFDQDVSDGTEQATAFPKALADDPSGEQRGCAVFSRRGDGIATGWLARYAKTATI